MIHRFQITIETKEDEEIIAAQLIYIVTNKWRWAKIKPIRPWLDKDNSLDDRVMAFMYTSDHSLDAYSIGESIDESPFAVEKVLNRLKESGMVYQPIGENNE